MDFAYKEGILDGTGVQVINAGGKSAPMTATLTSAAGNRKIELSSDGVNYYDATLDANTAAMINVALLAPVMMIRFTGAAGNAWNIR